MCKQIVVCFQADKLRGCLPLSCSLFVVLMIVYLNSWSFCLSRPVPCSFVSHFLVLVTCAFNCLTSLDSLFLTCDSRLFSPTLPTFCWLFIVWVSPLLQSNVVPHCSVFSGSWFLVFLALFSCVFLNFIAIKLCFSLCFSSLAFGSLSRLTLDHTLNVFPPSSKTVSISIISAADLSKCKLHLNRITRRQMMVRL